MINAFKIDVLDGQQFICRTGEEVGIFCENFRKDFPNAMLRILFISMPEDEYFKIPASMESVKYFEGAL